MSFEPRDYLHHILEEVEYLLEVRKGLTYRDFESNETLKRASVRSPEIIGEAQRRYRPGFVPIIPMSSGGLCRACATD